MLRRIIDLSVAIDNNPTSDPPGLGAKVAYQDHKSGLKVFTDVLFPGLKETDLIDREGGAVETVQMSTHNGTHLDAPYHYSSTTDHALPSGPRRSPTIDEIDLNWCFQPGVKLDFRHFPDGYVVTADDVQRELDRIEHKLAPLEIVVVNTCAGSRFGQSDYVDAGCGMGREATLFLTRQGIRLTGTDAWSWDAPLRLVGQRYLETGDASIVWEGHKAGRDIGYCHIEKLTNLEQLPPHGFYIACFPTKVRAASAGWTRAVAIFDNVLTGGKK